VSFPIIIMVVVVATHSCTVLFLGQRRIAVTPFSFSHLPSSNMILCLFLQFKINFSLVLIRFM
jgi:hypothetical protein